MNYAAIRNYDIANGEGVRTSLFVSGCTKHCPGCFNPAEQDFSYGKPYTEETEREILHMIGNPVTAGRIVMFVLTNPIQKFNDGTIQAVPMTYRVDFSNTAVDAVISPAVVGGA